MLLYGLPGTGKTKFAGSCPNNLFLATEPGQQFTTAPVMEIKSWADFRAAVVGIGQLKTKGECPYESFTIDIIDNLHSQCRDFICQTKGLAYPPANDFGKTWSEITTEWRTWLGHLMRLGNVIFISHSTTIPMQISTDSGAVADVDVHVPSFYGNKAAQYLDGILNCMGFCSVDSSGEYVITFTKTSTIGAKDRTDILGKIGPMPTNWDVVSKAYEKKAIELDYKVKK